MLLSTPPPKLLFLLTFRRSYAASVADIESLWDPLMGDFTIPRDFEPTAPIYKPDESTINARQEQLAALAVEGAREQKQPFFSNPQTERLCALLGLTNPATEVMTRGDDA